MARSPESSKSRARTRTPTRRWLREKLARGARHTHRDRQERQLRSDDEPLAVGSFCQCPDSGGHKRFSARRERNEMVAHFFDTDLWQARCGAGGHGDYARSKPETCPLDRGEWQEFDGDLRDPRPRRPFLWRKHNSEKISATKGS